MNILKNTLTKTAFWQINKGAVKLLGVETALLFTELIDSYYYFQERDMLTEDGFFFRTTDDMEEQTGLSYHKQTNGVDKLEAAGLIETDLRGIPAKRHFKILEDNVLNFLNTSIQKIQKLDLEKVETNNNIPNNNKINNKETLPVPISNPKKEILPLKDKSLKKEKPAAAVAVRKTKTGHKERFGLDYNFVLETHAKMMDYLKQPKQVFPTNDGAMRTRLHAAAKNIIEGVCLENPQGMTNHDRVRAFFYNAIDLYQNNKFPFHIDKEEQITIQNLGAPGIALKILSHKNQNFSIQYNETTFPVTKTVGKIKYSGELVLTDTDGKKFNLDKKPSEYTNPTDFNAFVRLKKRLEGNSN